MNKISLFGGTGFIGSKFNELYKDKVFIEKREEIVPHNQCILYMRGTTSNYSVFSNPDLDVYVNLGLFTATLKNLNPKSNFNLISSWFCEYPKGFYSITKLCQEQLLESYCKTFDITYKILRLSNVFGHDSKASAKKNALEFIINKIKNNEDIELYDGDNYRNFLPVDMVCKAVKFVMEHGKHGEIYNIGANKSYRMGDLFEYCIKKTNSKSIIKIVETPKFHAQVQVKDYWMDTTKLKDLGFDNNIDIYKELDKIL